jgi:hypothetical protein
MAAYRLGLEERDQYSWLSRATINDARLSKRPNKASVEAHRAVAAR